MCSRPGPRAHWSALETARDVTTSQARGGNVDNNADILETKVRYHRKVEQGWTWLRGYFCAFLFSIMTKLHLFFHQMKPFHACNIRRRSTDLSVTKNCFFGLRVTIHVTIMRNHYESSSAILKGGYIICASFKCCSLTTSRPMGEALILFTVMTLSPWRKLFT